ncbi:hypothetical protein [Plantactinospora sp. GCM10030261]|uniref:hypothetical protein n=1 Tax=Plantactinospora sp. GCM10030261 TaxID=3273420 RepID=UPI00361C973C
MGRGPGFRTTTRGYLTWAQYLDIEAKLAANNTRERARPVREGTALGQGIIFCGVCGGRVGTRYDRRDRKVTYSCQVKDHRQGQALHRPRGGHNRRHVVTQQGSDMAVHR